MLVKLTSIIEYQSEREKSWEQTVAQYGGPKRILNDPDDLQTVANIIEDRSLDNSNLKSGPKSGTGANPTAKGPGTKPDVLGEETKFNRKELLEVQRPLSKLLDESRVYYERKLDAQIQILANQIEQSTQRILRRIDGGYWEKIQDPDIRTTWKENVSPRIHGWKQLTE